MTSLDYQGWLAAEAIATTNEEVGASSYSETEKNQRRFDSWFQPQLVIRGPNAEALLAELEDLIAGAEIRVRRRKARDRASFQRTLNSVVANAFWGDHFPVHRAIAYSRGNDAYRGSYWPDWLTPDNLRQVIDGAVAVGLLDTSVGKRAAWWKVGYRSTFQMAPLLLDKLFAYDMTFSSIAIDADDLALIVLKDSDGEPVDLVLDRHAEANAMAQRLALYNAFLGEQRLSIECSRELACELEREMRDRASKAPTYGKQFRQTRRPEIFRATLYRVFNDGRWDHGGRFVGGWWQQIPSRWRQYITINREPTVELDYSGFAVRAIYHRCGMDYRDDPYQLPQLEALNLGQDYRPEVKRLVQAMLNCPPGMSLLHVNIGRRLPRPARRTRMIQWLTEKHDRIAHTFRTREGVRIQGLESTIVDRILEAGKESGTVVLPIHDSFVVPASRRDWLMSQMMERYREIFRFDPVVGEKDQEEKVKE